MFIYCRVVRTSSIASFNRARHIHRRINIFLNDLNILYVRQDLEQHWNLYRRLADYDEHNINVKYLAFKNIQI